MLIQLVEQLRRAIEDEGREPRHHQRVQRIHREQWPVLWRAIDALLAYKPEEEPHVINLHPDGWTIQHPLHEREDGSLFGCKVRWTGGDVGIYGRFVMEWDELQDDWVLGERQ